MKTQLSSRSGCPLSVLLSKSYREPILTLYRTANLDDSEALLSQIRIFAFSMCRHVQPCAIFPEMICSLALLSNWFKFDDADVRWQIIDNQADNEYKLQFTIPTTVHYASPSCPKSCTITWLSTLKPQTAYKNMSTTESANTSGFHPGRFGGRELAPEIAKHQLIALRACSLDVYTTGLALQ